MRRLNELDELNAQIAQESLTEALCLLMEKQLHGLERMIELHSARVKDPGQYNAVAAMIEQLEFALPGLFRTPEHNLTLQQVVRIKGQAPVTLAASEG